MSESEDSAERDSQQRSVSGLSAESARKFAENFDSKEAESADVEEAEKIQGGQEAGRQSKKKKTYRAVQVPTHEQIMQEDFFNNCAVRTGLSAVMGAGLGAMFGIAMGTFDTAGAGLDGNPEVTKQTTRQVLREMFKNTTSRSWSYAKGFSAMGALFAGSECVIEKSRAKHDMYNSIYAGCFAGGALAYSTGPKGMCLGCASFAAFSYMIDRFLER